ncbi:MAG: single-stranded-DNA-specific exonuclease RecJ [Bacteriovoracales bacterium]|nr:single-stranded-DNA-specific exonuclease RecJ [Bacteriovoracales bacterium]
MTLETSKENPRKPKKAPQTPRPSPLPSSFHPILKKIFESRQMDAEEVERFLSWDLKELPPLTSLLDLDEAAHRLLKAIDQKETIGIYGDYDVDGTTSCALFHRFFQYLGVSVRLYQPDRFKDGYGLHVHCVEQIISHGVTLLITVDCGITDAEAADYAAGKGLDLIITDHHKDAREEMPKALAVVNPNRRDESCPPELKALAGVGVAFAVCLRTRELALESDLPCPSLYPLLPFVAIGTLCDMVELGPMNLKLVRHGLKAVKETRYEGLKKLFPPEQRKRDNIESEYISFYVGPLINSKGRLDHPEKALELLTTDGPGEAFEHFNQLTLCNQKRKAIQNEVFDEAKKQILAQTNPEELYATVAYAPHWHEGVIGIVASKLVETFKVPSIVFSESSEKGIIKGSARSAGALNMHEALSRCSDLFTKFGGHRAAAGLSMPTKNLELFKKRFDDTLRMIEPTQRKAKNHFDLCVSLDDIGPELALSLELLEPFGAKNPKPVFRAHDALLESFQILKDQHVRWTFRTPSGKRTFGGISFFFIGRWGALHPKELTAMGKKTFTIEFSLGFNHFRGNKFLQLNVSNIF